MLGLSDVKWEYRDELIFDDLSKELNRLGRDGWEIKRLKQRRVSCFDVCWSRFYGATAPVQPLFFFAGGPDC